MVKKIVDDSENDKILNEALEKYKKAQEQSAAEKVWIVQNYRDEFLGCFRSVEKARKYALKYYEKTFADDDRYDEIYDSCLKEFAECDYITDTVYVKSVDVKD